MSYNPNIHHRKSIRLQGYDYSQSGAYFITICTKDRECFFGEITDGIMALNDVGRIAEDCLVGLTNHFSHGALGEYVVMPNHVHCIVVLYQQPIHSPIQSSETVKEQSKTAIPVGLHFNGIHHNQFSKPTAGSVSVIIQQYKSSVKRLCNKNEHSHFKWQSRFHDHIIRTQESYEAIARYIVDNPARWEADRFYKQNM